MNNLRRHDLGECRYATQDTLLLGGTLMEAECCTSIAKLRTMVKTTVNVPTDSSHVVETNEDAQIPSEE